MEKSHARNRSFSAPSSLSPNIPSKFGFALLRRCCTYVNQKIPGFIFASSPFPSSEKTAPRLPVIILQSSPSPPVRLRAVLWWWELISRSRGYKTGLARERGGSDCLSPWHCRQTFHECREGRADGQASVSPGAWEDEQEIEWKMLLCWDGHEGMARTNEFSRTLTQ